MTRLFVFDDYFSFVHFVLGALTRFLASHVSPLLALAVLVAFLAYEVYEQVKDGVHVLGDIIEYMTGYIVTDIVI